MPVDLAMRLYELGYNVERLEDKYLHGGNDYGDGFSYTDDGEEVFA